MTRQFRSKIDKGFIAAEQSKNGRTWRWHVVARSLFLAKKTIFLYNERS
jgi:hypothetical protein